MKISHLTKDQIRLRIATQDDTPKLVTLLNRCYRSDEGWTNEANLIGGIRTTDDEIYRFIQNDTAYLFVFEHPNDKGVILACIGVEFITMYEKKVAYIGTFAVIPELQGKGVGDTLLSAVETFATRHADKYNLDGYAMSILSHRPELLKFYQRRGYQMSEYAIPFPTDGNNGEPKQEGLLLHWLFKQID
ncbi:GNAT family N-acetyltransferase [Moraxella nasovis]|uniref:GNAT family N-acetyltransferase n=1 Tax=Moraxella nasovis TaxID=2904121 RepID=UPI001F61E561|nr:GNAT family N-acetyltransferase [Moraxella nasovis]UNU73011.1 GNAT family N-acetyltransferase [Moraxella nasovis]